VPHTSTARETRSCTSAEYREYRVPIIPSADARDIILRSQSARARTRARAVSLRQEINDREPAAVPKTRAQIIARKRLAETEAKGTEEVAEDRFISLRESWR